jgi:hypothetical protein
VRPIAVACLGVVVLAEAVTGCGSRGTAAASKPTVYAPPSTPAASPTLSQADQLQAWFDGGGTALVHSLSADLTPMGKDAKAQDLGALSADCTTFGGDVDAAVAYKPIPDRVAQEHWAAALSDFKAAASSCTSGAAAGDQAMLDQYSSELGAGTAEVTLAVTRVHELQDS